MEDDNDKVRRNLVVFSGLIIITAFLGLPFTTMVDRFVAVGANWTPDPLRTWIVLAAVHVYLAMRFQYQAGTQITVNYQRHQYAIGRKNYTKEMMRSALRIDSQRIQGVTTMALMKQEAQHHLPPPEVIIRDVAIGKVEPTSFRSGLYDFDIHYNRIDRGDHEHVTPVQLRPYQLPTGPALWRGFQTFFQVILFSQDAMSLVVPCLLCLMATWIIAFRIGSLW